jgi:hypothetical protein
LQGKILKVSRIFKTDPGAYELEEMFRDDEKCLKFLAEAKWKEGFVCRKCGNTNYCRGKTPHSRRCTKCKTEESAAAGTIFHNCKFPLHKAFFIAWNVCRGSEEVSTYEFARKLSLRQMTCWNFKTKIKLALNEMDSLTESERESIVKILS